MTAALVLTFASLGQLTIGEVKLEADRFQFTEGPVWLPSGELAFSDIPADTIFKLDKSALHKPSGNSNGLTLDSEGRLIRCEHGNRRVARVERNDEVTVLADSYQGKKLNSPNDAVMRS
ncbi:MAG: SMP-30/gluconolactonase/LRE family protein, partial [Candidatus Hydrogenedentota bacterium]